MTLRPRRVVPAVLVALVVLAACVLVAVSCLQQVSGRAPLIPWPRLAEYGARLHWQDTTVLTAGGIAAGLGIVVLLCALLPGRPTVVPLAAGPSEAGLSSRGLRYVLTQAAAEQRGVTGADVRVGGRHVHATVSTTHPDTQEVRESVGQVLEGRLDRIDLASRPPLRIRVRTRQAR
jgi:hypothetical protein